MSCDHLQKIIHIVEKSLKQEIESFFLSVYPANYLISHGLEHHHRVWQYAKELIRNSDMSQGENSPLFFRKIMIACYFHDIGMATNPGINHGVLGMKHCTEFLRRNNLNIPEYKDTLEAIEHHDDKEYITPRAANNILKVISAADDLDAFGYIGIYRYSDIYVRRDVKPADLGLMIRRNATGRFENFVRNFGFSYVYTENQRERFNILDRFFIEYNSQLPGYTFGTLNPSGYCGVVEIIINMLDNKEISDLSNIFIKYSKDPVINWFFRGLSDEINPGPVQNVVIPPSR